MPLDPAEVPHLPRRHNFSFYVVLVLLVVPLSSTLPASWLFVTYSLCFKNILLFSVAYRTLFLVALCEVLFSIYWYHLSTLIVPPGPCGPLDPAEVQKAYQRLLKAGLADLPPTGDDIESERPASPAEPIVQLDHDDPRAIDFRNYLRNWFSRVPFSSIKLHQVRQWIYWSMYNANMPPLATLPDNKRRLLDSAVQLMQKRAGLDFQEGSNPNARVLRLTTDDIQLLWRPLTFYVFVNLMNQCLIHWYSISWRVQYRQFDGVEYLIRTPKHWDSVAGSRPIVFIHGLGVGLLQYNETITRLFRNFPDRPILILLQPQISQNIFHPEYLKPLPRHEMAGRLARLFEHLQWVDGDKNEVCEADNGTASGKQQGVTMLSHSNGTYTHAWMLKGYPKMISRSCFVDPVTFCCWEGDVCYNFVYRPCRTGFEMLTYYFVGSEIGVANLIQRHFDWTSNSLFYDEIPNARDPSKAFFMLGGKDSIVNAERVKQYLTSHGIKKGIWCDPNGLHGQVLVPFSSGQSEMFRWLHESDY